jgi:sugar lactone lactonase YvrE
VARIDLEAGTTSVLFHSPVSTDGITFAPDYRRLYFNSEGGKVMTLLLGEDGEVVEPASLLTTIPTSGGSILDGMTADVCGNLYVVVMDGRIIRVLPDGTQEEVADLDGTASLLISAANFGSGTGGWERDHLYVMSLWKGLYEIDIGIEGKWEPHL